MTAASTLSSAEPSSSIGSPFKKHRGDSITAGEGRVLFGSGNVTGEELNPISETLGQLGSRAGLGLGEHDMDGQNAMQTPLNSRISTAPIASTAGAAAAAAAAQSSTSAQQSTSTEKGHPYNAEDGMGSATIKAEGDSTATSTQS